MVVKGITHSPLALEFDFAHNSHVRLSKKSGIYRTLIEDKTKAVITISKTNSWRYRLVWTGCGSCLGAETLKVRELLEKRADPESCAVRCVRRFHVAPLIILIEDLRHVIFIHVSAVYP